MVVVADTSPLNYLICIAHIEILQQLYGTVIIPPQVRDELLTADAPQQVKTWVRELPDWIEICQPDSVLLFDPRWQFVDLGERAALALVAQQPCLLLI